MNLSPGYCIHGEPWDDKDPCLDDPRLAGHWPGCTIEVCLCGPVEVQRYDGDGGAS